MSSKKRENEKFTARKIPSERRREIRQEVYDKYKGVCQYCFIDTNYEDITAGVAGETYPTLDHVIPASDGGEFVLENLILACMSCNDLRGKYQSDKKRR